VKYERLTTLLAESLLTTIEEEAAEYFAWLVTLEPAARATHNSSIQRLAWIIETKGAHLPPHSSWPWDRTCDCEICNDF
jgi:hypothetical protein